MPVFDYRCPSCTCDRDDVYVHSATHTVACPKCSATMDRVWKPSSCGGVIDDSIPGGMTVDVPFGYRDGKLQKFYSKTEVREAAKRAGYEPYVQHRGSKGGDKSTKTSRWI
jgi:hypothetical protein